MTFSLTFRAITITKILLFNYYIEERGQEVAHRF